MQRIYWVAVLLFTVAIAGCLTTGDLPETEQDPEEHDPRGEALPGPKPLDLDKFNVTVTSQPYSGFGALAVAFNMECDYPLEIPNLGPDNLGGACLEVIEGAVQVNVTLEDDMVDAVGGYLQYFNTNGDYVGSAGYFCQGINVQPPKDANYFRVTLQDPAWANVVCLSQTGPHAPTTGVVTITVYHP